jgi:hypothetical protein
MARYDSRRNNASIAAETTSGHFADLSKFAVCLTQGASLETGTTIRPASGAGLAAGHIIRLHDGEYSRLHNRIMLVIRTDRGGSSNSMACLSFCKHGSEVSWSPGFAREHASVHDARGDGQTQQARSNMAQLKVYAGEGAMESRLEPGVWVNIREIWSVDLNVRVAVLGRANKDTFSSLLDKVKELFCATLGDRDLAPPPARRPSTSQTGARRPSGAREERTRNSQTSPRPALAFLSYVANRPTN